MPFLRLAFAHLAIGHKQPDTNRQRLLTLVQKAGEKGAHLVLAPELAVSGYSFANYNDMAPYAETADGPTITALAQLCQAYALYACVGLAERDPLTGILYNSAFVLDPGGNIVCRYRKINAECRWACPGDSNQDNTFATPWGRIGVLICSDSYHSLMPRVTALRGASLLLVVANWPPTGLDPLEIWRARAVENGLFVAACNRTGRDLIMDCRQAQTAVVSPQGTLLMQKQARTSKLMKMDLFLNDDGKLKSGLRIKRMAARKFTGLHDCYLNLSSLTDLTAFLQLPPPGQLLICCHCPGTTKSDLEKMYATIQENDTIAGDVLHIFPFASDDDETMVPALRHWCGSTRHKATVPLVTPAGYQVYWIDGEKEFLEQMPQAIGEEGSPSILQFDCGPARIHILPFEGLYHPERVLASAKKGADLVIIFSSSFNETIQMLAGVRTIEQTALVVCSPKGAGIWMTPEGHQRWEEVLAKPGERCQYCLDTTRTRNKRFQDKIDFQILMRNASMSGITESEMYPVIQPHQS